MTIQKHVKNSPRGLFLSYSDEVSLVISMMLSRPFLTYSFKFLINNHID